MYIERHIEQKIIEVGKTYPAILVTGPRQAGKTTMLKKLMEDEGIGRKYVSLDDLSLRDMAQNDPAMFLQIYKPPILIDEVQYAPNLFTYIKIYVDSHQNAGDFWLTGSQIYRLMRGVSESLAGRVAIFHISPLSQREINGANNLPLTLDVDTLAIEMTKLRPCTANEIFQRIWKGSMPAIASGKVTDRNIFYSSYLSTYLERDVRYLSDAINALKFNRFITAVAARTAQMINYNAIAEDADIDVQTAKNWMNILETLGIVFLLHPYSNNVLKRTVKTPKLYFYDTGLVCYLTRWSAPENAEVGAMNGALFENFVISEIIKGYQNAGIEPYLYYYRDRDAKEIDVILEKDGALFPIEIKKTAMPDSRMLNSFGVLDKATLNVGRGAIVCMAEHLSALGNGDLVIPAWLI